jgi:addiction module HigA family antidote
MSDSYKPITPGEYLEEEFLKPFGITQSKLSRDLDIPISRINNIIRGKRIITVDTALRLSEYFKTSAEMWLNLQSHYDLRMAKNEKLDQIKNRIRPFFTNQSQA